MIRNRKLNRLKDHDYSTPGYYFVTICTKGRVEWFGEIKDGAMALNECGKIVCQCWNDLPNHYQNVALDKFVVMPNHCHGVVVIKNIPVGNGLKPFPTEGDLKPFPTKNHGLSEIMRGFKTFSSRRINTVGNGLKPFPTAAGPHKFQWQKSFYDHIIRNEIDLNRIREYIVRNPLQWPNDRNHPSNLGVKQKISCLS